MRFASANFIKLFLLVFAIIVFLIWVETRKRNYLRVLIEKKLISELLSHFDTEKHIQKQVLMIFGLVFMIFSLMRPQMGLETQKLTAKGLDILIAVDVSKSMLAQDILPDRLTKTKLELINFVKTLKFDRIGLIAFAGDAFLVCPITDDYNGFLLSVNALDTNIIQEQGTSIANAIKEAVKVYKDVSAENKILILITDGEDHEGNIHEALELAKKESIRIFCIGVGTTQGALIPTKDKDTKFLKDKTGKVVTTKLNEELLQEIALTTKGSYFRATASNFGLLQLYEKEILNLRNDEFSTKVIKQYKEYFQIPLFFAFLFLLFEFLATERKD